MGIFKNTRKATLCPMRVTAAGSRWDVRGRLPSASVGSKSINIHVGTFKSIKEAYSAMAEFEATGKTFGGGRKCFNRSYK